MMIPKVSAILCILTATCLPLAAAEITNIPQIGAHQPILTVEKNVHPENRLVVYTKVDDAGHFVSDPKHPDVPLLDFYWLMDGRNYKPVNPLIKSEIRKRLEIQPSASDRRTHFVININDLKEVNSDIKQPRMDVSVSGSPSAPDVEAEMTLGPSDGNARMKVSSIYTEGRAFPPAVYSVTLNGEKMINGNPSGKKVERKYDGKDKQNESGAVRRGSPEFQITKNSAARPAVHPGPQPHRVPHLAGRPTTPAPRVPNTR